MTEESLTVFRAGGVYVYTHPNKLLHKHVPSHVLVMLDTPDEYGNFLVLDNHGRITFRVLARMWRKELA